MQQQKKLENEEVGRISSRKQKQKKTSQKKSKRAISNCIKQNKKAEKMHELLWLLLYLCMSYLLIWWCYKENSQSIGQNHWENNNKENQAEN